MSWLIITWALVVGYSPFSNGVVISTDDLSAGYCYRNYFYQTLELEATVWDTVSLWTELTTKETKEDLETPFFSPFESCYKIGLNVFIDNITFGIEHECTHPVVASRTVRDNVFLFSGYTNVFVKIQGETSF